MLYAIGCGVFFGLLTLVLCLVEDALNKWLGNDRRGRNDK